MPKLSRITAGPAIRAPRATSDTQGGGRGLELLGQGVQDVGRASEALWEASMTARTARSVAEASAELDTVRTELEESPDFETAEQVYADRRKEVLAKHKKGLGGVFQGVFDQRMFEVSERIGLEVRRDSFAKRNDQTRADVSEALRVQGDLAGKETDPKMLDSIRTNAYATIEAARLAGAVTAQQAHQARARWDEDLELSQWERRGRENPGRAAAALDAGEGSMDPRTREAMIGRFVNEDFQRRREARIEREHAEARDRQARADFADAVERDMIEIATNPDPKQSLSHADLMKVKPLLTPTAFRYWSQVVQGGGRIQPKTQVNRATYGRLYDQSLESETAQDVAVFREEVRTAFLAGEIGKPEHDSLLDTGLKARADDARRLLIGSLQVGESMVGSARFIAQSRGEQARLLFEDWLRANPEFTREQAVAKAVELSQRALLAPTPEMGVVEPRYTVRSGGKVDINGTAAALRDAFGRGEMSEDEYASELWLLEQLENAQKLKTMFQGEAP